MARAWIVDDERILVQALDRDGATAESVLGYYNAHAQRTRTTGGLSSRIFGIRFKLQNDYGFDLIFLRKIASLLKEMDDERTNRT